MPLVFSYGSLQQESVQLSTFGRRLAGSKDALPGHALGAVEIPDPARAAVHGRTHYANVAPDADPASRVDGMALEVTPEELAACDGYERLDGYVRVAVTLASGREAWCYVDSRTLAPGAAGG